MENCPICIEPLNEGSPTVLSCGHTFHAECAVQWFRYNHSECPMCRSDNITDMWSRVTPVQRVAYMRKHRDRMPCVVAKQMTKYDGLTKSLRDSQRNLREFEKRHRQILKDHRQLRHKLMLTKSKQKGLLRQLSTVHVDQVPLLVTPVEDYNDSDATSDEEI